MGSIASANKQKLDELLGIVSQMQTNAGLPDVASFRNKTDDIPDPELASGSKPEDDPLKAFLEGSDNEGEEDSAADETSVTVKEEEETALGDPIPRGITNVKKSLNEIDSLISLAKQVMHHVYSIVTSSDILDAATITAAANLIKETRNLVEEHLEIQKSQQEFLNKLQMEEIKHQHQIELMEKKFELEQKRSQAKNPPLSTSGVVQTPQVPGMKSYSSADMMRMLDADS